MLDPFHPRHTLREQETPANTYSFRSETKRFNHFRPSRYPTINIQFERSLLPSCRIGRCESRWISKSGGLKTCRTTELGSEEVWSVLTDLEQDVEGWSGGVELPTAVV